MNSATKTLVLLIPAILLGACMSPDPEPQESPRSYQHTFSFLWEQVQAELDEKWKVERVDEMTRELETAWKTNPGAFSRQGYRHRLLVSLEGDDSEGWVVTATQSTERNHAQKNPLSEKEEDAEWKGAASDNAEALTFLTQLDIRLNPRSPTKDDRIR